MLSPTGTKRLLYLRKTLVRPKKTLDAIPYIRKTNRSKTTCNLETPRLYSSELTESVTSRRNNAIENLLNTRVLRKTRFKGLAPIA